MLWEDILHISGIANPHTRHQRITNPLERKFRVFYKTPCFLEKMRIFVAINHKMIAL